MQLKRIGFVGWRGMVGSVLMQRMRAEQDFSLIEEPCFFSTSQSGLPGPDIGRAVPALMPARDLDLLMGMDVIVSCQGGDYTQEMHPRLREQGWSGYWIDAASTLRMDKQATIILDPVNLPLIQRQLAAGRKDFIGGNCTVSLMVMALHGLLQAELVEWITVATYQAISGAGARQMRELIQQMGHIHSAAGQQLADAAGSILELDQRVLASMRSAQLPSTEIGAPLAGSLLPWVDADLNGHSREEQKGAQETNKILARQEAPIPIESTCIRIGTMRCHSQAFTLKLKRDLPLDEIEERLAQANPWVRLVANTRASSLQQLTPAAVTGSLEIAVGRVKKLRLDGNYLSVFTVGDQLLWGAAEPLRRMLHILHRDA